MRACDADRERTADLLRNAFVEGRLNQEELDERLGRVYAARTYADLAAQTADLPVRQALPVMPLPPRPVARQTNSAAIGSFVCGLLQIPTLGISAIPAVVLGHSARRQIRRTGQPGDGYAVAGLVLGWLGIAIMTIVLFAVVAVAAHTTSNVHSSIPHYNKGRAAHSAPKVPGAPPAAKAPRAPAAPKAP